MLIVQYTLLTLCIRNPIPPVNFPTACENIPARWRVYITKFTPAEYFGDQEDREVSFQWR